MIKNIILPTARGLYRLISTLLGGCLDLLTYNRRLTVIVLLLGGTIYAWYKVPGFQALVLDIITLCFVVGGAWLIIKPHKKKKTK